MKYYRRIIKIGNSFGVTLPKKDLPYADMAVGDIVEIKFKKVR